MIDAYRSLSNSSGGSTSLVQSTHYYRSTPRLLKYSGWQVMKECTYFSCIPPISLRVFLSSFLSFFFFFFFFLFPPKTRTYQIRPSIINTCSCSPLHLPSNPPKTVLVKITPIPRSPFLEREKSVKMEKGHGMGRS